MTPPRSSHLRRRLARFRTIRVRLTLWYVALLGLILLMFSAFLYVSLARSLLSELDTSLSTTASQVAANLNNVDGQMSLGDAPDTLPAGTVAVLYDRSGQQVLARDPRQALFTLPGALARAAHGQSDASDTVKLADGSNWRVYTTPLGDNGMTAILQVARSERDVELALRQLVVLIAVAIPATLLLAVAGGLFLAGRALGPIDNITRAAGHISAENLGRRLNFNGFDDEVGRLAATFDGMLDRLEAAFQRQRQFTADASHELRTPLAMLRSQIDVALQRRRRVAEHEQILASLREDTERLSQLVSELLTLARADAGEDVLGREPVDLHDLAEQVVGAMQPLAESRTVRLQLARGTSMAAVVVVGDQTRLTQLLVNLVDNGLKYTPANGTVVVSVLGDGDAGILRVTDTGVGIAAEHLPHVFERFYRADPARSRAEGGAGLGLAICQWIAHAHGGTIQVESEAGRGTTVSVVLPCAVEGVPNGVQVACDTLVDT